MTITAAGNKTTLARSILKLAQDVTTDQLTASIQIKVAARKGGGYIVKVTDKYKPSMHQIVTSTTTFRRIAEFSVQGSANYCVTMCTLHLGVMFGVLSLCLL